MEKTFPDEYCRMKTKRTVAGTGHISHPVDDDEDPLPRYPPRGTIDRTCIGSFPTQRTHHSIAIASDGTFHSVDDHNLTPPTQRITCCFLGLHL
mmetsp:Transcript_7883/g.17565  ORF Transcript_7883/g.17565 Transcript_7883/m.17565 type:complete len:94 (-) Transcript_7883:815-1096(-)